MDNGLRQIATAHTKWGGDGSLHDASSYGGKVDDIEARFLSARKALATIAGVNCLQNMQGATRLEKRDKLLKQAELMPEALVKLLRQQK